MVHFWMQINSSGYFLRKRLNIVQLLQSSGLIRVPQRLVQRMLPVKASWHLNSLGVLACFGGVVDFLVNFYNLCTY